MLKYASMKYLEIKIEENYDSVYIFLKQHNFSEHFIKNLRSYFGAIVVNGKAENVNKNLKRGDVLRVDRNPFKGTDIEKIYAPIDIVYEDEYYLIINKPALLPTTPSRSHYHKNLAGMICAYINDSNFTLRIMNRLDMDASGLIVVAKDTITYQNTVNIEKEYYAICHGKVTRKTVVDAPVYTVVKDGINERKRIVSPFGQYAKTTFTPIRTLVDKKYLAFTTKVIRNFRAILNKIAIVKSVVRKKDHTLTLVKAEIFKGRTHQIRLHASSINHPLIGDKLYGISDLYSHSYLHLKSIKFHNMELNRDFVFSVPFPKDFLAVLGK